ncbi:MAG: DUF86 domain-containing protein [Candidatus Thorarchaeota archaeon]|nr:MAG: DUF86 domain-containing protein [Candidatus Thorarchaeota archaeon]
MDQLRKTRYKTKMRYVVDSLSIAESLIQNPTKVEERALYYCLFTSIESTMDLIAMLIKDKGNIPMGDNYNVEHLVSQGFVTEDLALHLKRCNGLRNVLVHQYNGIDREIVLDSFKDVKDALSQMVRHMEEYLDES